MDFEVDLSALGTATGELSGMSGTIKGVNSDFSGSYLNKLSGTEIGSLSTRLKEGMDRLEKGYANSDTWLTGFNSELNALEGNLAGFSVSGMNEIVTFNTEFTDLFTKITAPVMTTAAQKEREELKARLGEHLKEYTYTDSEGKTQKFYMIDTPTAVEDYEAYLQKYGIYQNAGLLGGDCMLLSQYYGCDLLRGTYTNKGTMADRGGSPATRMNEGCVSENEQDILNYVYNEVNEGNPVVLQVTQRMTYKGWRHLVTVVGYDSSVKSAEDLTPDKILVLDCVDGKVQRLSDRNRKLYNQGGKYLAYGPTETFKASISGAAKA